MITLKERVELGNLDFYGNVLILTGISGIFL